MLHDVMPGTEVQLQKEMTVGYIGFDPTADSLHIGNLVQIMMLKHFQLAGHKPVALVGGATGMVGDPSGKSEERNMLDEGVLFYNLSCQQKQLEKFLDFNCGENSAYIVNNYDWFKEMGFLQFLREAGKYLTVSYMMAKDSVQNRLEKGISFTEFSYQLVQGFDFYHLWKNNNVKLQMGGSDQWGNIVTGTELIRRKTGGEGEAFALTCPLLTKSDGGKFGKTESGSVWLDAKKTSPYKFYQFWLNASDEDAAKYIRIFTLLGKAEIEQLETQHKEAPHLRVLQKALARDITIRVHCEEDLKKSEEASEILFGKGTSEGLKNLSEEDFLDVFEGVPQYKLNKTQLSDGIDIVNLATTETNIFPSKGEARKMITAGGFSINKDKQENPEFMVLENQLINNRYLLLQKGKKNYYVLIFE